LSGSVSAVNVSSRLCSPSHSCNTISRLYR